MPGANDLAPGFAILAENGFALPVLPSAPPRPPSIGTAWFASILDQLPAAVYLTDAEGRVTYLNPAAAELAGRDPLIGVDRWCVTQRLFTTEGEPLAHEHSPMARALRERRPLRGAEVQAERPDGSRIPLLLSPTPLFDDSGRLVGGFNLLTNISDRKRAEARIAHLLRHDVLTGLPNRHSLDSHLAEQIAQAKRNGTSFLLMRIDVDRLKWVNGEHGHPAGDTVLAEIAARLRAVMGEDFAARFGGDEFMLISQPFETDSALLARAERVVAALCGEFDDGAQRLPASVSAGCARFPQDGESGTLLLAAAQAALRRAKDEGRACARMFDIAEQGHETEHLVFRRHLRQAIETGAITLHYQPQFRPNGEVIGFEALARWRDPVRGVISPTTFIPAAEEGGLIAALGAHVLRSACREAANWQKPLRIAVNISPLEFVSDELPGLVEAILTETGLDPDRLELEITEGVMVTDAARAMTALSRLRALGVRIALDDFGTGYSSLSYLHRFPLTTLKIDRSFVATLGVTLEAAAITRAVIQLGHALGIEVVAEGVETPEQLDFLISEGCDLAQGYLLGRPLDASAYEHLTGRRQLGDRAERLPDLALISTDQSGSSAEAGGPTPG